MKIISYLLILFGLISICNCQTKKGRLERKSGGTSNVAIGEYDAGAGGTVIEIPPVTGPSKQQIQSARQQALTNKKSKKISGFGLAESGKSFSGTVEYRNDEGFALAGDDNANYFKSITITKSNSARISAACYKQGESPVKGENFFFHAEILEDGDVVHTLAKDLQLTSGCASIIVRTTNLRDNVSYTIKAGIIYEERGLKYIEWRTADENQLETWTVDSNKRTIELFPQNLTKNLEVVYRKTPEDICRESGYLWDGDKCLDTGHLVQFQEEDKSSTGVAGSYQSSYCMSFEKGPATLQKCEFKDTENQLVSLKYYAKEKNEGSIEGDGIKINNSWYSVQVGECKSSDNCTCLKYNGGKAVKTSCQTNSDGTIPEDQLFAVLREPQGSQAGYNVYRLYTKIKENNKNLCITLKRQSITNLRVVKADRPLDFTDCNTSEPRGQYIKFINKGDYTSSY